MSSSSEGKTTRSTIRKRKTVSNNSDDSIDENDTNKYIISLNKNLQKRLENYIAEYGKLEEILESYEDDMERTEKVNVHLKSILKNFHEIAELNKKISSSYKLTSIKNEKNISNYINDIKFNGNIINLISILFIIYLIFAFMYNRIDIITTILSCVFNIFTIETIYVWSTFKICKNVDITNNIKKYQNDINDITKSLDYINEYIDAI
jgi:hypothetical protein